MSQCRPRLVRNCARERGPITTNACCRQKLRLQLRVHGHSWLWVPDRARCARLSGTTEIECGATILDSILKQSILRRHCERSEAIHCAAQRKNGLLRRFAPRNDGAPISDISSRSRGAMRPKFCTNRSPKINQRAQETPGARCTRSPCAMVESTR